MNIMTRCGTVAIVGRPNVGKSTLLNSLLGYKLSIVSDKPHTTRAQIIGVTTHDANQAVYLDTPGLSTTRAGVMPVTKYLSRLASGSLINVDIVLLLITAPTWQHEDDKILAIIKRNVPASAKIIVVINKIDLCKDKNQLLPLLATIQEKGEFTALVPLAAIKPDTITSLATIIDQALPLAPHQYSDPAQYPHGLKHQAAELIREQLMQHTWQELPYVSHLEFIKWQLTPRLLSAEVVLMVPRPGQQKIIIGTHGSKIKLIATKARLALEEMLGRKVMLRIWVKVKSLALESNSSNYSL